MLTKDPRTYFCATAAGPLGGIFYKRGIPRASASIYFSDGDLPHIEIQAYRDAEGAPCIRIEARIPGNPLCRIFYDGPLSKRILQPAPRCPECEDRGWAIFNEAPEEDTWARFRPAIAGSFLPTGMLSRPLARLDGQFPIPTESSLCPHRDDAGDQVRAE